MLYLLKVSICAILFYGLFYIAYRQKSNHELNRFYLLSALLLSFVLPLIQIPIFPEYIMVSHAPAPSLASPTSAALADNSWDWENGLLLVYLVGFFISLGMMAVGLFRLFAKIKSAEAESREGYTQVLVDPPYTLSSFFNYLLIPRDKAGSLTIYELTHELVHIHQRHSWDIILVEVAKAILWFNPIVYSYKKSLVAVHEYLADAKAIESYGVENYQAFLVQQVSIQPANILVHNFYSLFKNRIQMIHNSENKSRLPYWLILPVVLMAVSFFSFTTYQVQIPSDEAMSAMANDTIPAVDTVITFDPATGEETIAIVKSLKLVDGEGNSSRYKYKRDPIVNYDTVRVYDPATGTESTEVVRWEQKHELDTITTFDPETYKETVVVVDPNTGVVDTLVKNR